MDFGIFNGWQVCPSRSERGVPTLTQLSRPSRKPSSPIDRRGPPQLGSPPQWFLYDIGDVVTREANIASVINTDAGKAVKMIGNIIREGNPVIEVTSFLSRDRFTVYENTFEIVQEPDHVAEYPNDAPIGVLLEGVVRVAQPVRAPGSGYFPHLPFEIRNHIQEQSLLPLDHRLGGHPHS